jgi:hypothetical protein
MGRRRHGHAAIEEIRGCDRMLPQYWNPVAPKAASPASWREMPSGTARPPLATNTIEPGAVDELLEVTARRDPGRCHGRMP